ncbi:L,D-transpeptidase family protein [Nocardioides jiangxiensis]|uniref:Murein L,D-transpeptidase n=1 Tax=Nocardioides jiangxiensis TaxID=3064524 RepID=A0ABT9AXL8_9ACTN|nr:murein L,D-transpeptidase [Nocardioides sp. WY-20]MDO7867112.1 murein L,D-transpeptidase [Nocardioides sp. WY-20]
MSHLGSTLVALVTTSLAVAGMVSAAPPATAAQTVASAQRLLNDLGCDAGVADGVFGTRSKAAVIKFQAANALAQTASLDTATWRRLGAATKVRCDRRPVPAGSGSGRRIVVSRTQNYVWLVRADGTVRWQGGVIDNPSVFGTGTYPSGAACGRPAHVLHNTDYSGTLRLDHYSRIRTGLCGVGFHRVPVRKSDGTQIHADWLLGTNLKESHGCLRVTARTAQEIWDFTQSSVPVVFRP